MRLNQNRLTGLSEQAKIVALEAENQLLAEMLSDTTASLIAFEQAVKDLRQALYLDIPDTE